MQFGLDVGYNNKCSNFNFHQMNQVWMGLLGGLLGSVLTIVITKLLDIFQLSKQHQYEFERKFFDKKLAAAELTMTQFSILSNSLSCLSTVYERYNEESNDVEDYVQNYLVNYASQQLEIANNASFIITNSLTLYFDIQSSFLQNNIIRKFFALLASMGPLANRTNATFENYMKGIGTANQLALKKEYLDSEKELGNGLKRISQEMIAFDKELHNIMIQIRDEMSRFDY